MTTKQAQSPPLAAGGLSAREVSMYRTILSSLLLLVGTDTASAQLIWSAGAGSRPWSTAPFTASPYHPWAPWGPSWTSPWGITNPAPLTAPTGPTIANPAFFPGWAVSSPARQRDQVYPA